MPESPEFPVGLTVPHRLPSTDASQSVEDGIDRRETGEQLWRQATLLDLSFDAILVWKIGGGILYWNRGAQSLYGYSIVEALDKTPHELLHTIHPRPLPEIVDSIFREGKWEGRLLRTAKNGRRVTVHSRQQLVNQVDGQFVFEINRDITDLVASEQALTEGKTAADLAIQANTDFLAKVSHEIRSPLGAILGFTELLVPHDEDDQEKISTIRRNVKIIIDLINDVLELSIIEAGRIELHHEIISPTQLLEELCSLFSSLASQKSVNLSLRISEDIPVRIVSDPTRLRQILVNLLANAIKFTDRGSIIVSARMGSEINQICFEVADTGIGISHEQQRHLFKPFEQADSTIARQFGGSGLGLAISQRLAHFLGGMVYVQSEVGSGSTFTCCIACERPEEPDDNATPESSFAVSPVAGQVALKPEVANQGKELLDLRILVVDDRRDIRRLTQHIIGNAGAEVVFAENGRQALELIAQDDNRRPIDLILMDVHMPELDGLETTRRMRSAGYSKPIVALTADATDHDRAKCLQAGYTDFLTNQSTRPN